MKITCTNCQSENDSAAKYCNICGFQLPILENQQAAPIAEPVKESKDKKKFDLKAFIGFMVAFIIMFFVTQSLFKPSIDTQLAEFADEFNKTCPMTIDQYTSLKNVVALPNKTIQYNYVLTGISKAEVQLDTVKKYLFPGVLQNVKTNPGMKLFRDNKVTLNYYYADKNGEFVTEYVVKPAMYE